MRQSFHDCRKIGWINWFQTKLTFWMSNHQAERTLETCVDSKCSSNSIVDVGVFIGQLLSNWGGLAGWCWHALVHSPGILLMEHCELLLSFWCLFTKRSNMGAGSRHCKVVWFTMWSCIHVNMIVSDGGPTPLSSDLLWVKNNNTSHALLLMCRSV